MSRTATNPTKRFTVPSIAVQVYTRRDLLAGGVGACIGVAGLTIGTTVADEVRTTEVRYVIVRNTIAAQQSIDVLFESDDGSVSWETYDLEPEQAVELDGFDRVSDYQLSVQWKDETRTERLEPGSRAIAIVLASVGGREIVIRDVPYSSLSSTQRSPEDS